MMRSHLKNLPAALLGCLAFLLCLAGSASAAFERSSQNIASRDFFWAENYASENPPEPLENSRERLVYGWKTASDALEGPNVYTYVRQNPWTMFDPHGLKSARANNGETRLMRYEYTGKEKDHSNRAEEDYKLTEIKERDYNKIKGKVDIFINGIQNTPRQAARNAHDKMGDSSGYMIYNPAESFLKDTGQCMAGKFTGNSRASRETTQILAKLQNIDHGKSTIHAHSQGTIIATNAIRGLANASPAWRKQIKGIKAKFWGPAVNKYRSSSILKRAGANYNHRTDWKANKWDPVSQVLGLNAFTDRRPWRFGMGIAAAPYMTNSNKSPHSNKNGPTQGLLKGSRMK